MNGLKLIGFARYLDMKIVVIGPTLLTKRCLEAILKKSEDEIAAVFTLKDQHAPYKARFVSFDDLAEKYGFKLYKVDNINDEENVSIIKEINPDLILELGWSQIISGKIINLAKKGCVGVHAAMLPKNRGGASLNWALIKGEKNWGITLYYLNEKVDKGKIIAQKPIKIEEQDNITSLHEKSDFCTIELLMENLPLIREDKVEPIEQDESQATYLSTRKPIEGLIIWDKQAGEIHNLVRALTGDFPGAFTFFNDKKLFIWESETNSLAESPESGAKPGEIVSIASPAGIAIQTGQGFLSAKKVQLEGETIMTASDFAKKYNLGIGNVLGGEIAFKKEIEKWLLHSGIQNLNGKDDTNGAFNAWYDLKLNSYPYVYSEITGYGITTLLYLNSIEKNPLLIDRAVKAADWLINHALLDSGGVLTRKYSSPKPEGDDYFFESGLVFAFDSGMVLFALANLFKETRKEKYLKAAKKIADFLLTLQREDGLFEPIYNTKTGEFINTTRKWSSQSGSFLAKLSLSFLALYDITKDEKYKEAAVKVCQAALKFQEPDGRFISFRNTGATHLHPHCYTCEALYYTGKKLKNDVFIKAALKGTVWALNNQLLDGGLPCFCDKAGVNRNQRSDVLTQVLRLAVYFLNDEDNDDEGCIKARKSDIYNLASKLLSFQNAEGEQAGGFYYGWTEEGKRLPHLNSWCSMFSLQALHNLGDYLNNRKISIDYLI